MNQCYCNGMVHVIKEGETLYQLSRQYRVPLPAILRANPYVDVYNLQIGQEICIPMRRPMGGMTPPVTIQPRYEEREESSERVERVEREEFEAYEPCEECDEMQENNWGGDEPKSLGRMLREMDLTMEEFAMKYDLDEIMVCEKEK